MEEALWQSAADRTAAEMEAGRERLKHHATNLAAARALAPSEEAPAAKPEPVPMAGEDNVVIDAGMPTVMNPEAMAESIQQSSVPATEIDASCKGIADTAKRPKKAKVDVDAALANLDELLGR